MIVKSSFIGIAYNYAICYLYNLMDNARKKRKYRAIVACLLLLTMMPFFFVKAFHVHKEDLCISHDEQKEKDITVTFPLLSLRAPPVQLLQSLSWVACIIR